MVGAIRKRDILWHPFVTIHCFGWQVFLKALLAGRDKTFLAVLTEVAVSRASTAHAPELVGRCVILEKRVRRIYQRLAARFAGAPGAHRFFLVLAAQERDHAELLELCQAAAGRQRWNLHQLSPWRDALPQLEIEVGKAESAADSVHSLKDALRLVLQIESSEVNYLFRKVITANRSPFVQSIESFHTATITHLTYVRTTIPTIAPDLAPDCEIIPETASIA